MNKYKIIAIIGPSGSGKDKLLNTVCRLAPDRFNKIITTTTRPKRQGEVHGRDYWFIDDLEFKTKVISQEIIGYACFNNWYYGTSIESLSTEKPNIGVFNPEAIWQLTKNENIDLTTIWLHTSDKERLLRQLNREDNPNVNEIVRRFQADEEDFKGLYNEINAVHIDNETFDDLICNTGSILTTFG